MAASPLITIVTRTRDRPRFLSRCIESVLAQTRFDWRQVIVNDGGNAAEVEAVVARHSAAASGRIEVRHRSRSTGMEAASNLGFEGAATPWLTLLDDDDTWAPTFLSVMLAAAQRAAPRAAGVVCRSITVNERFDGESITEIGRSPANPALVALGFDELTLDNLFTNNAFVFSRELFEKVGVFDGELLVYGDWDFALRCLMVSDVEVVPEALAHYHRRSSPGAPNSFNAIPHAAERYRALLVNKWLRGEAGRSPEVGTLLALAKDRRDGRDLLVRLGKYFDVLHRARHLPLVKTLDRLLASRSRDLPG